MATALDQVTDFPALVDYLRDELEWPIPADISLEEATYDVTPEELGLKKDAVGGGIEIKQLRPLNRAQPWGVFFLNLPSAKLPVTLVRNILGKLAVKKRASANSSERAAFQKHDLLFIAATGTVAERRLAFAHFADDEVKGDAATLKVLGWDANDTPRRMGLTETSLRTKLHWPDDPADADHWRKQWSQAFAHADTRTVVRDSKQMAKELAALARRIRDRAKELIAAQTDQGSLVKLHKAFKEALIHDLMPDGFADTYAQTIAYGLLSTAISRASGALTQDDMAANVAGTSPFLKEMLGTFIEAGGRKSGKAQGLDFDELGITEVVELLRNADMEAVLADFDRKNPDEDPVIHFYELFLKEYDAAQKVKRGVFYTPRSVVGFIVRSVDEVLRTEFGLEDGLASTATWGEVIAASKSKEGAEIKLPEGAKEGDPFVRILDPATGTGTFLVECVDLIHQTMVKKWKAAGKRGAEIRALWNAYVPAHLLPRLTGFELMMAPYAIAHVKLGLKLADTGYTFGSDARAQIYLTNALEPAQDMDMQLAFMSEALAHEAKAANAAKETRFTVVVGNPPYAGASSNQGDWILRLLHGRSGNETGLADYYSMGGLPLKEKKLWLQDDYVKFTRLAQLQIELSGVGTISMITNNSFIDGPTYRGMRDALLTFFSRGHVINLHGSAKRDLALGKVDENVFDIQQGVAISTWEKFGGQSDDLRFAEIFGERKSKYGALNSGQVKWLAVSPTPPWCALQPTDSTGPEYFGYASVKEIFPLASTSVQTSRDGFDIGFDDREVIDRVKDLTTLTVREIRNEYGLEDGRNFSLKRAIADVETTRNWRRSVVPYLYRCFDTRSLIYRDALVNWPRHEVMDNLIEGNIALLVPRQVAGNGFQHVFLTEKISDMCTFSGATKEAAQCFPLWLTTSGRAFDRPNLASNFTRRLEELSGLAYDECVQGPKQGALGGIVKPKPAQTAMFAPARPERGEPGKSFGPRDLFDYLYAVLHSPAYRARYADYLKSDFPRIPLPGSRDLFDALVPLGTELVALHLLDVALPILKDPKGIRLAGSGEARVAHKPEYDAKLGRVTINATRWFESVPQVAWDFLVGGYQPAQKWLKDRAAKGGKKASAGRVLTDEDILHYCRMVVALTRTAELMSQIDAVVEEHGGWPGAFRGMTDEAKAEAAE